MIGVSVATYHGGQNLNFAIPSNYLAALVAQVGNPKPFSRAKPIKSQHSILTGLGGKSVQGVTGDKLTWTWTHTAAGDYSFSLRNRLRENVGNVYCFVIFYDAQGDPIDVNAVQLRGPIPAGLAKRVDSEVHSSVQELTTRKRSKVPHTKVEIRVLDFEIVE